MKFHEDLSAILNQMNKVGHYVESQGEVLLKELEPSPKFIILRASVPFLQTPHFVCKVSKCFFENCVGVYKIS